VRQGDPLSPILFNFVADSHARLLTRAQENNILTGLCTHLIPHGLIILQYVNDTIICINDDFEKSRNLKMILCIYELMSGLKINFLKSEIFVLNGDNEIARNFADLFNCQVRIVPMKYLGVPLSPSKLHIADWTPLEEKCDKILEVWKGSCLYIAGRIALIDTCLANSPIYHMSMYLLPKVTIKALDAKRKRIPLERWWREEKNHLVNVKGKCVLGPFLSILVIECKHKCLNVNLCPWMNKVQIISKGMFLSLSTLVLYTNILV
jgi:hypothetical protein